MHRNSLLAATFLSAALIASPALAQDEGTSPEEEVAEGSVAPDEGEEAAAGQPVETAEPNAPDQEPAFAEQTRAPQPEAMPATTYEVIAEELPHLWSLAFLPDGGMLVTAKNGAFHYVSAEGEVGEAITEGVPEDVEVIFQQEPSYDGTMHFGSRLVFSPEGDLYVTVGERSDAEVRDQAQDLSSGLGKVFRIDVNGEAPSDNPFVDQEDALPQIWSYGHRNMQSAALDGQGRLWTVEHGPRGGDELNRPEPGLNYGWPNVTYGLEYDGDTVGQGVTQSEDTEQPVYYWDPSFAPSGMAYYEGEEFPEWQGAFLIGGLVSTGLVIVHIEDDLVAYEERVPLERRVRDVRVAPDGSVYVVTEDREAGTSEILRITRDS